MQLIDVVVETPMGSARKFDFDPVTGFFRWKKTLPAGLSFPFDFGFIPGTKGQDGDPLDALVISEFPGFPGCLVSCRLIGAVRAEQSESKGSGKLIRNDRFFAVPTASHFFSDLHHLSDLPDNMLTELEDFFIQYNKLEGKTFRIVKEIGPKKSLELILEHGHHEYGPLQSSGNGGNNLSNHSSVFSYDNDRKSQEQ